MRVRWRCLKAWSTTCAASWPHRTSAPRLDDAREELRARPAPADAAPTEPAELRRLRGKIDELQDMVRERNQDLAALRREVVLRCTPQGRAHCKSVGSARVFPGAILRATHGHGAENG